MKRFSILLVLVATLLMSCGKDKETGDGNNGNGGGVPTVSTTSVVDITSTSAVVNAKVENDGGSEVTERGIEYACASFSEPDHDCYIGKIYADSGSGEYQCEITDLIPNTTYYVRAFATNEAGTAYGKQKSFMTLEESEPDDGGEDPDNPDDGGNEIEIVLPQITTATVTEITETSAVAGGDVISDGGAEVTARGVCWSVNPNPTMDDKHTEDGTGVGQFVSNLPNLAINTTYYLRAYATNEVGTSYGEEVTFTTLEGNFINGYEYVDLGLPSGTKWATHNVGATSPEEVGRYYAWGDPKAKIKYSAENCPTYGMELGDISGNLDYDIATIVWGGAWRMPTAAEARELIDNCSFVWDAVNNVAGAVVTGPNGNSIFLPAGGFVTEVNVDFADSEGAYWTSSPDPTDYYYYSRFFYFYNTNFANIGDFSRYAGLLVRPVTD